MEKGPFSTFQDFSRLEKGNHGVHPSQKPLQIARRSFCVELVRLEEHQLDSLCFKKKNLKTAAPSRRRVIMRNAGGGGAIFSVPDTTHSTFASSLRTISRSKTSRETLSAPLCTNSSTRRLATSTPSGFAYACRLHEATLPSL